METNSSLCEVSLQDSSACVQVKEEPEFVVPDDNVDVKREQVYEPNPEQHDELFMDSQVYEPNPEQHNELFMDSQVAVSHNTEEDANAELDGINVKQSKLKIYEDFTTRLCQFCGMKFDRKMHWSAHLYAEHNLELACRESYTELAEVVAQCNTCGAINENRREVLQQHFLSHQQVSRFLKCRLCNRIKYDNIAALHNHLEERHSLKIKLREALVSRTNCCIYCLVHIRTDSRLCYHYLEAHKELDDEKILYVCPRCGYEYNNKQDWKRHCIQAHGLNSLNKLSMRQIDKTYACSKCPIILKCGTLLNLLYHASNHMAYTIFKCRYCYEEFQYSFDMRAHVCEELKAEIKERRLKERQLDVDPVCNKELIDANLAQHLSNSADDIGETEYVDIIEVAEDIDEGGEQQLKSSEDTTFYTNSSCSSSEPQPQNENDKTIPKTHTERQSNIYPVCSKELIDANLAQHQSSSANEIEETEYVDIFEVVDVIGEGEQELNSAEETKFHNNSNAMSSEPQAQFLERKQHGAEFTNRTQMSNETPQQRKSRLNRERKLRWKARQSEEALQRLRQQDAQAKRQRLKNESLEQAQARRAKHAELVQRSRQQANKTSQQKTGRLAKVDEQPQGSGAASRSPEQLLLEAPGDVVSPQSELNQTEKNEKCENLQQSNEEVDASSSNSRSAELVDIASTAQPTPNYTTIQEPEAYEKYIKSACPACGKPFKLLEEFMKHAEEEHGSFKNLEQLRIVKIKIEEIGRIVNTYVCQLCDYKFQQHELALLLQHAFIHMPHQIYSCTICGLGLESKQAMLLHLKRELGVITISTNLCKFDHHNTFCCPVCDKRFKTRAPYTQHLNEQHQLGTLKALHIKEVHNANKWRSKLVCMDCGQATHLTSQQELLAHRIAHLPYHPYECLHCKMRHANMVTHFKICKNRAVGKAATHSVEQKRKKATAAAATATNTIKSDSESAVESDDPLQEIKVINSGLSQTLKVHSSECATVLKEFGEHITYACPECNIHLETQQEWNAHVTQEHDFFNEDKLNFKTTPNGKAECKECGVITDKTTSHKQRHKFIHLPYKSFICKLCTHRSNTVFLLGAHLERCHFTVGEFKCFMCDFVLETNYRRHVHCQMEHTEEEYPETMCTHCMKLLGSKEALRSHMSMHDLARVLFNCFLCARKYVSTTELRKHLVLKHGDFIEKYTINYARCLACFKVFKSRLELKEHIKTHKGENLQLNPLVCTICHYCANTSYTLGQHIKLHHTPIYKEKGRYKCKYCQLSYAFRCSLVNHCARCHADIENPIIERDPKIKVIKRQKKVPVTPIRRSNRGRPRKRQASIESTSHEGVYVESVDVQLEASDYDSQSWQIPAEEETATVTATTTRERSPTLSAYASEIVFADNLQIKSEADEGSIWQNVEGMPTIDTSLEQEGSSPLLANKFEIIFEEDVQIKEETADFENQPSPSKSAKHKTPLVKSPHKPTGPRKRHLSTSSSECKDYLEQSIQATAEAARPDSNPQQCEQADETARIERPRKRGRARRLSTSSSSECEIALKEHAHVSAGTEEHFTLRGDESGDATTDA